MLIYRELPPEEWYRVKSVFEQNGTSLPATGSHIVVAEEGDQVVSLLVLQYVPHLEPMWVAPSHRGKVKLATMAKMAEKFISGGRYFVTTTDHRVENMYKLRGMVREEGCWRKDL